VERREAEAVDDAGREVVVEVLLRVDRQIQQLTARVDRLERTSSRLPSRRVIRSRSWHGSQRA
jgi:predicted RecB family endonuclease